jgi:predicted DNA-binding protein (UPF0251 family)
MNSEPADSTEPSVIFGDNSTEYVSVQIPATKPPEEFSVEERRAEIFKSITQLGHPSRLNQTELAERYGVSQPMIHKDLNAIADSVADRLGDRHELEIESVFRRSIRGLLEEGEWRKAAQTAKDYAGWMNEQTEIQELREDVELLKEVTEYDP